MSESTDANFRKFMTSFFKQRNSLRSRCFKFQYLMISFTCTSFILLTPLSLGNGDRRFICYDSDVIAQS